MGSLRKTTKPPFKIIMNNFTTNFINLTNQIDQYASPFTKYALPLLGLFLAYKVLVSFWRRVLGPLVLGGVKWTEMGDWAVVAGASYGIGGQYAKELAKRGCNLIIIGHDVDGLKDVENTIKKKYSVQVRSLVADFSNGMEGFDAVKAVLNNLDVGILINTAAIDLAYKTFDCLEGADLKRAIDVNCGTPTVMMNMVLPGMLAKKKGVIVNFGSFVGEANCPMPTVYPATKTFCHKLTRDLQVWYQDSGIIFQTVLPGVVGSPMAYNMDPTFLVPSPEQYTSSLIKTVGWVDATSGYLPHDLQLVTMKFLNFVCGDFSMIKYLPYHKKSQLGSKKKL